ncbi:MAG: hypothetical protein JSU86_07840 [Phycisphaerales bacterium]|nr:MAG: hypothetical protein JSU86_07840 [Phycisphaerales bacterium]
MDNIPEPAQPYDGLSGVERLQETWEDVNLNAQGEYVGCELHEYGFVYDPGDVIPENKRYAAMVSHRHATRCKVGIVEGVAADLEGGA